MADPASHGFAPHLDVHCDDDSVLMRRDTRSAKACQAHLGAHLIEEWEHDPNYVLVSHGAFRAARKLHKAAMLGAPTRVGDGLATVPGQFLAHTAALGPFAMVAAHGLTALGPTALGPTQPEAQYRPLPLPPGATVNSTASLPPDPPLGAVNMHLQPTAPVGLSAPDMKANQMQLPAGLPDNDEKRLPLNATQPVLQLQTLLPQPGVSPNKDESEMGTVYEIYTNKEEAFQRANQRLHQQKTVLNDAANKFMTASKNLQTVKETELKGMVLWQRPSTRKRLATAEKEFKKDAFENKEMARIKYEELRVDQVQTWREKGKAQMKADNFMRALDQPQPSGPQTAITSKNQTTSRKLSEEDHGKDDRPPAPPNQSTSPSNTTATSSEPPPDEASDWASYKMELKPEFEAYFTAREHLRKVAETYKPLYEDYQANLETFKAKREKLFNYLDHEQITPIHNQTSSVPPSKLQNELNALRSSAFAAKQKCLDTGKELVAARKATKNAFEAYYQAGDLGLGLPESEPEPEQEQETEPEPEPEQEHDFHNAQEHDQQGTYDFYSDPDASWQQTEQLLSFAALATAALIPSAAVYLRWFVHHDEGVLEESDPCMLIYNLHTKLSTIVGAETLGKLPSGSLGDEDKEKIHAIQSLLTKLVKPYVPVTPSVPGSEGDTHVVSRDDVAEIPEFGN